MPPQILNFHLLFNHGDGGGGEKKKLIRELLVHNVLIGAEAVRSFTQPVGDNLTARTGLYFYGRGYCHTIDNGCIG